MNKRLISVVFLALLLIMPLVASVELKETEITIKTYPNYDVQVTPYVWDNGGAFAALEKFRAQSDEYGDASFTLSSGVDTFNLAIFIKNQDGKKIIEKREEGYPAGEDVYLELALKGFIFKETPTTEELAAESEITNTETNQTTNETEVKEAPDEEEATTDAENDESNIETNKIETSESEGTGFAVFGDNGILSTKRLYYVIGVLGFAIVIFIAIKTTKHFKFKEPKEVKTKKLSEIQEEKADKKKEIEEAEEKVKKAKEELEKLKED